MGRGRGHHVVTVHVLWKSFLSHPSEQGSLWKRQSFPLVGSRAGWGRWGYNGALDTWDEMLGTPTWPFAQGCPCPNRPQEIGDKSQFEQQIQHRLTAPPRPSPGLAQLLLCDTRCGCHLAASLGCPLLPAPLWQMFGVPQSSVAPPIPGKTAYAFLEICRVMSITVTGETPLCTWDETLSLPSVLPGLRWGLFSDLSNQSLP